MKLARKAYTGNPTDRTKLLRIDRVSSANAYHRELRRSDPRNPPGPNHTSDRFYETDVIFDLTAEAAMKTGRADIRYARQPRNPPETYTESGTLAYSSIPVIAPVTIREPIRTEPLGDGKISDAPISMVTFDGMLRAPARDQIRLIRDPSPHRGQKTPIDV